MKLETVSCPHSSSFNCKPEFRFLTLRSLALVTRGSTPRYSYPTKSRFAMSNLQNEIRPRTLIRDCGIHLKLSRSVQDKQCLIISTVYTKEFCRNVMSRVLAICWGRTSVISTNNYNHTCGNAIHRPPYKICTYA
jgi:hypothetical protein